MELTVTRTSVIDGDGNTVCTLGDAFEKTYAEGLSQAQKMEIGKAVKPYKDGRKSFDTLESPVIEEPTELIPLKKAELKQGEIALPWDAFPRCPAPGAAGDKTPEVVWYIYNNHPEYYRAYYANRRTIVDEEHKANRLEWEEKGAKFYQRGLKITDCPSNATPDQKGFFEFGYKKYMMSELDAQNIED